MSLKSKIFLGFSVSVLVVFSIFSYYTFGETSKVIIEKEEEALELLSSSIDIQMEEQLESAELSVLAMVNNPEVQQAFSQKDRKALERMLLPTYDSISDKITQIQFHLPDSTSFLRLHQPDKFGDSLKDFRFTVNEANETQQVVKGLEEGVAGYGFRVVVPVSYLGNHVGSVEFGSAFGEGFLKKLKEDYTGEYFTYEFIDGADAQLLNGSIEGDSWIAEDVAAREKIKGGETLYLITADKKNNVLLVPFKDYRGDIKGYFKVVQSRMALVQSVNNIKRNSVIYTGALLALLLGLFYVFLNYSLRPISDLVKVTERVAAGDLTQIIAVKSKDEVGTLAMAFNQMTSGLRTVIGQSDGISERVASTSQQLSAAAQEVTAASEEVAHSMTEVSESASSQFISIEESSVTMKTVLTSMDHVNNNIQQINHSSQHTLDLAQEGITSSKEAVVRMNNLKDATKQTSNDIRRLNESSKEIEGIVGVIGAIADQTNLLALNAAIEAARAGESGRGFSVVAEEVKQLAEQSAHSADQIAKIIVDIQNQINVAVSSMDSNSVEVEAGVEIVDETSEKFVVILDDINIIAKEIEEVTKLTQGVAEDARGVTSNFSHMSELSKQTAVESEGVAASSEEQAAAMEEITSSSIDLANMAGELRESISTFEY